MATRRSSWTLMTRRKKVSSVSWGSTFNDGGLIPHNKNPSKQPRPRVPPNRKRNQRQRTTTTTFLDLQLPQPRVSLLLLPSFERVLSSPSFQAKITSMTIWTISSSMISNLLPKPKPANLLSPKGHLPLQLPANQSLNPRVLAERGLSKPKQSWLSRYGAQFFSAVVQFINLRR